LKVTSAELFFHQDLLSAVAESLFLTFNEWRISMPNMKKIILSVLLSTTLISLFPPTQTASALSLSPFPFVLLSDYKETVDIGDQISLIAITSTGKKPTWKSSNSSIASVNTYGMVTAKKAGTATIIAKIKDAEASCNITVNKTKVVISTETVSMERGEKLRITANTSNDSEVTWKSSRKSIATIDEYGNVTAIKPGDTTITASADGSNVTCLITVRYPTVELNKTTIQLYRGQTVKLSAIVSSNVNPTWKTNKKSVAIVDQNGTVTAQKHGTATITATVDTISKTCEIIVLQPDITLSSTEISFKKGTIKTLTASVSSGNKPIWSTSNSNIVSVNQKGEIKALKKGTAYVYASEDGTKAKCTVRVTE
jgi:uncharacterized protein YjdB